MEPILFFILLIIPFVVIFIMKKYYQKREIFLQHSVDQLVLEKTVLEKELVQKEDMVYQLEKELLEIRKTNLDLGEQLGRTEDENKALRNLVEALQKKQESKNEDIVVEYLFKQ